MKPGEKIRYLREHRFGNPLTQDELCASLNTIAKGLDKNTSGNPPFSMFKNALSRYETGKIDVSSVDLIQALCIFFEVNASYFIVHKMPYIVELFELDVNALNLNRINLHRINDKRIKSEIECHDDFICKEFAVNLPISTENIYHTNLDYLMLDDVSLQPFLVDNIYIRVKFMNSSIKSKVIDEDDSNVVNGSYLVYLLNRKELGIYEKLASGNTFYSFENRDVKHLGATIHDNYFFIGLISSEESIMTNKSQLETMHNNTIEELHQENIDNPWSE